MYPLLRRRGPVVNQKDRLNEISRAAHDRSSIAHRGEGGINPFHHQTLNPLVIASEAKQSGLTESSRDRRQRLLRFARNGTQFFPSDNFTEKPLSFTRIVMAPFSHGWRHRIQFSFRWWIC
jgi:hypothetical protein